MVRKRSLLLVLTLALVATLPATAAPPKVSGFGKYSGYSEAVYDGWGRSSQYVPMRDGTRLAVDIVRPTLHGRVATERLPVVWTHTRYQRAYFDISLEGMKVYSAADADDWLGEVVRHGYVVAAVDARGTGASFGTYMGWFSSDETRGRPPHPHHGLRGRPGERPHAAAHPGADPHGVAAVGEDVVGGPAGDTPLLNTIAPAGLSTSFPARREDPPPAVRLPRLLRKRA